MDIRDISRIITENIKENNGLILETKCPKCGAEGAYLGLNTIECPNNLCAYYKKLASISSIPAQAQAQAPTGDYKADPALQRLAALKDDINLSDEADSSCTTGFDNDGSTGLDIFGNGFELSQKASGRDVYMIFSKDGEDVWFFIGTADEVRKRIAAIPDETP